MARVLSCDDNSGTRMVMLMAAGRADSDASASSSTTATAATISTLLPRPPPSASSSSHARSFNGGALVTNRALHCPARRTRTKRPPTPLQQKESERTVGGEVKKEERECCAASAVASWLHVGMQMGQLGAVGLKFQYARGCYIDFSYLSYLHAPI